MDNVSLICIAEANPSSNITIENPRGDYITEVPNSNIARHMLRNASYKDAGEYTCRGRNNYTRGLSAMSNFILIVKCLPRPSSGDTSVQKVATIIHMIVTLKFSAWNYLEEPNKTIFSWFKKNRSLSDNYSKYIIRTDGLQTTLSIRNTTQHDIGLYRVKVTNSAGSYIHNYDLKDTDKPDPPIGFKVTNDSITANSVALTWSPGFNGGFQKTFVILYKMKFDTTWLNKLLIDTGNMNMNYTLYDLKIMQEYEIEMFARNIEGNSAKTDRLTFKTKASLSVPVEGFSAKNTGAFVGVALGSILTTLVVVALAIIGYKRLKNYKSTRCKDQTQGDTLGRKVSLTDRSQTYSDLDTSKRDTNVYDTVQHQSTSTYERLNIARQKSNEYMELKDSKALNTETSDYVNIRI